MLCGHHGDNMADVNVLPPELLLMVIKVFGSFMYYFGFSLVDLFWTFLLQVFYLLDWSQLGTAMSVCKRWAEVSRTLSSSSSPVHKKKQGEFFEQMVTIISTKTIIFILTTFRLVGAAGPSLLCTCEAPS